MVIAAPVIHGSFALASNVAALVLDTHAFPRAHLGSGTEHAMIALARVLNRRADGGGDMIPTRFVPGMMAFWVALVAILAMPHACLAADAAGTPASCGTPAPGGMPTGNLKLSLEIDPQSAWSPPGGDVKFTLRGAGFSADGMSIVTCFRWRGRAKDNPWIQSPALRLTDNSTVGETTFTSTVPWRLRSTGRDWFERVIGQAPEGSSTGFRLVPLADFRVVATGGATSDWFPLDIVQPIGITNSGFALVATLLVVIIAWVTLYAFGRVRGVPGSHDAVLQLISTRGGYASLSQLQITLWAFVIGGSAVYVMALSGNLIEISQGTLVLLGISGISTLGAKFQSGVASAPPANPPAVPGPVGDLRAYTFADAPDVRLTWTAPATGGQPDQYAVDYQKTSPDGPGPWVTASTTISRLGFRVVGLDAGATYVFRVSACNAGGVGEGVVSQSTTTAASPAGSLGPVSDVRPGDAVSNNSVSLSWTAIAGASDYQVAYRRHNCDDSWSFVPVVKSGNATLKGLSADTTYDVKVAAGAATAGATKVHGQWTTITVSTAGPRVPRWSDLVIDYDGANEIDVTRVQMLFFTVITALFVMMRVLTIGAIPVIPDSFLLLMGISNGVYLTAKFVPS